MRRPPLKVDARPQTPSRDADDLRCGCGCLLARITARGLELKCRRCRRHLLVSVGDGGAFTVVGSLLASGPAGREARG